MRQQRGSAGRGCRGQAEVPALCKPELSSYRVKVSVTFLPCDVEGEEEGLRRAAPAGVCVLVNLSRSRIESFGTSSCSCSRAPSASEGEVAERQAESEGRPGQAAVSPQLLGEENSAFIQDAARLPGINRFLQMLAGGAVFPKANLTWVSRVVPARDPVLLGRWMSRHKRAVVVGGWSGCS